MKRKISFRFELILFMLISLFISFALAFLIRNNIGYVGKTNEEKRIHKIYEECIGKLEEDLMYVTLENRADREKTLSQYRYLVGYEFYLVDAQGNVVDATIDNVQKIDNADIYDGMKHYSVSRQDKNVFQIQGCDYLKDGIYLFYNYLKYDENDTGMVFGALAGSILIFFLLIWGRISYISKIRAAVSGITAGEQGCRVSCRYSNELGALAEDINKMAETLEEEEQKKNEFLTNISHDIRTPLTTILGYLEMIKEEKYDSKEEMQEYLNIMQRKGNFLASMLEDFFQYSKLQSEDIKIEYIDFELNELLRQFYEDELEEFAENSLELKIELCEESTLCSGDTDLLARVVNNLLMNALKYAKENTQVTIKSFIEEKDQGRYVCFWVRNIPGKQISEEQVKLLFERLYKCDAARSEGGSGLGLSIVQSIVKLHHGFVEAYLDGKELVIAVFLRGK